MLHLPHKGFSTFDPENEVLTPLIAKNKVSRLWFVDTRCCFLSLVRSKYEATVIQHNNQTELTFGVNTSHPLMVSFYVWNRWLYRIAVLWLVQNCCWMWIEIVNLVHVSVSPNFYFKIHVRCRWVPCQWCVMKMMFGVAVRLGLQEAWLSRIA